MAANSVENGTYENSTLGFHYTPPTGMRDTTSAGQEEIRKRAEARHTAKTLDLLLAMASGPDDTAPDWHAMAIETYPRTAWSNLNDFQAAAKMNVAVAGSRASAVGQTQRLTFSEQNFAVSRFELREGAIVKKAVVYTTVRQGKVLSFAFSGNSPQQVQAMTGSMKTLVFSKATPEGSQDRN